MGGRNRKNGEDNKKEIRKNPDHTQENGDRGETFQAKKSLMSLR